MLLLLSSTATTDILSNHFGESYMKAREAMNGMLSIDVKYHIEGSHWKQFSHDVIAAFKHPIFAGLNHVNHPKQV